MGYPKFTRDIPLRPIVSSRGSINYELAKELSRILRPMVGSSPHHMKNTADFVQQLKGITLQANEDIVSYDVSALFTSVPIDPAISIIRRKLELDQELHLRTSMNVEQITSLPEFCLKTTYFQFQGRFFEQLQGAAMGSPISPIVANLYMEDFENKAINTTECPPRVWKRYVDDTFVVIEANKKQGFLNYINNVDPFIHFTTEDARTDGSIPFLDTIVMPQFDGSLLTSVYRNPTHTDQYLQWNSHHHLSAKFSVINTLKHRAKTVCSNQHLLKKKEDHLIKALKRCKYSDWPLSRANTNQNKKTNTNQVMTNKTNKRGSNNKPMIVVPYIQGIGDSCKNICRKQGVNMYFKRGNTIKDLVVHPKDRDTILQKIGVIYRFRCGRVNCEEEYIGESSRTFAERFREHMKAPSPIHDHYNITGHEVSLDNFSIVAGRTKIFPEPSSSK